MSRQPSMRYTDPHCPSTDGFFQQPHRTRSRSSLGRSSWITLGLIPFQKVVIRSFRVQSQTLMGSPDFGGSLPASSAPRDPFLENLPPRHCHSPSSSSSERSLPQLQTPDSRSSNTRPPMRLDTSVPAAHSPFNPFFGYPVSPTSLNPRHGRRRKRDLLRTLAYLWWARWKGTVTRIVILLAVSWFSGWRFRIWLNRRRQMLSRGAR